MRLNVRRLLALALLLVVFIAPFCPKGAKGEESSVTIYFPNWNVYSSDTGEVKDIPWDKVDCVNHAFWEVKPSADGYAVVSTDPWADTDTDNRKAHFPQYAEMKAKHPEVKILLSIGGWTACGYFSEMALTQESRASFIRSCLDTLSQYPFFDGIDIDWEYPGVARSGGEGDEGNPVLGDDRENYTLLLKELREALDAEYGENGKLLTVCAAASESILDKQDYAALYPYVNRVNLMTYDMYYTSSPTTGHHTALYGKPSADTAVKYLQRLGVPNEKIAIGSPFYAHCWKTQGTAWIGGRATAMDDQMDRDWRAIDRLAAQAVPEGEPGWHAGYDETAQAAYLWNDDPDSEMYGMVISYENERSLAAKLDYLKQNGLGGIIVWEVGGDDPARDYPLLTLMKNEAKGNRQ